MGKKKDDTIFALSTSVGQSAIAIIRISGSYSKKIAMKLCKIQKLKDRYAQYTKIIDLNSDLIDKGLIIFFKSPRSFTGEDLLELHFHGSVSVIKKLTSELSKFPNTRPARPGEFSKRAFLAGKGELLQFEGINNLIKSETENQRILSNKQIYGLSGNQCYLWRQKIIEILALIDAEIEFSEEIQNNPKILVDLIGTISNQVQESYKKFSQTSSVMHGAKIMIIGPTNAGKSSLYNFLLQDEKMITSDLEGTTTDQSEQSLEIFGCKATLIDSAGIRNTEKSIEKLGVGKTLESLKEIKKLILVLSPDPIKPKDFDKLKNVINQLESKDIVVIYNKAELKDSKIKILDWKRKIPKIKKFKSLAISCKESRTNNNMLFKVYKFLYRNLLYVDTSNDDYYFSEIRHLRCLNKLNYFLDEASSNLKSLEIAAQFLREALKQLDDLFGKHDDEKKLEIIFNRFCIGK